MAELNTKTPTEKEVSLLSNKVYQQMQPPSNIVDYEPPVGTIIYANQFSGIAKVDMPKELKDIFNSDYGEVGNNVLVQLEQKVDALPDGPWYVDTRDGVIYIHNQKKLQAPIHSYVYQGGRGELLSVSFETQYITKTLHASASSGIGPGKEMSTSITTQSLYKKTAEDYYVHNKNSAKTQLNKAAEDYIRGDLSYGDLSVIESQAKAQKVIMGPGLKNMVNKKRTQDNKRLFDESGKLTDYGVKSQAHDRFTASGGNVKKQAQQSFNEKLRKLSPDEYAKEVDFMITQLGSGDAQEIAAIKRDINNAKAQGNLEAYLKANFSSWHQVQTSSSLASMVMVERTYNLDQYYKNTLKGETLYTYGATPDEGRVVDYKTQNARALKAIQNNPNTWSIVKSYGSGAYQTVTVQEVTRRAVVVPQWRILLAYFSRKGGAVGTDGLSGGIDERIMASSGRSSRKITIQKLVCRMQCVGHPLLTSSNTITIDNVGKKWKGTWRISKVTHQLTPGEGYTCMVDLIRGSDGDSSNTKKLTTTNTSSSGNNPNTTTTSEVEALTYRDKQAISLEIGRGNLAEATRIMANAREGKHVGYKVTTSTTGSGEQAADYIVQKGRAKESNLRASSAKVAIVDTKLKEASRQQLKR